MSFVSRLARSVAVTFIALVAGLLTAFAVARLGTATEIYSGMEDLIWVVWGLFAGACVGLLAAVLVAPRLQLTRLAGFTIGVALVVVSLLMVRGSGSWALVFGGVPLVGALFDPPVDPAEGVQG